MVYSRPESGLVGAPQQQNLLTFPLQLQEDRVVIHKRHKPNKWFPFDSVLP